MDHHAALRMPLTAHLKSPNTPVSRFLTEHLPHHRAVTKEISDATIGVDTVRPKGSNPRWATLGRTIEYHLLYGIGNRPNHLAPGPVDLPGLSRAAVFGVHNVGLAAASASTKEAKETWLRVATHGIELSDLLSAAPEPSERVIRLHYIQSHFEDIYRGGRPPGPELTNAATFEELLDSVPQEAVDDITVMTTLARPVWEPWTELPAERKIFNPLMPSEHNIPADGDAVIGGMLLDVKTTIRPERMGKGEVYQLAGYLLLDTLDEYAMTACGLYMARQGVLVSWSVPRFLSLLTGAEMTEEAAFARLRELRAEFSEMTQKECGGRPVVKTA